MSSMNNAQPTLFNRAVGKARRVMAKVRDGQSHASQAHDASAQAIAVGAAETPSQSRVVAIGVSPKFRKKIASLNPKSKFEHLSFRLFTGDNPQPLPECDAIVIEPKFLNAKLLQMIREMGVPIHNSSQAQQMPLGALTQLSLIESDEIFDRTLERELDEDLVGSELNDQIAFIEAEIKNGNRTRAFIETFEAIVTSAASQLSPVEFGVLMRRYLNYRWEGEIFNEEIYRLYSGLIQQFEQKKITAPDNVYVTFAAMLASTGQYTEMRKVLRNVAKPNLSGYLGLRVALRDISNPLGGTIADEALFRTMQKNEDMFARLVDEAGGNVMIVGNGPQAVGQGRGADVDASGLVVRFNSYNTAFPHSHDYGTRTDIWVRMIPHPYVKARPDPRDLKQVMVTGANRLYRNFSDWDWFRVHMNIYPSLCFTPTEPFVELCDKIGSIPTSGLLMSYMLYKQIGPLDREQVIGCSFNAPLDKGSGQPYHYADNRSGWSQRHAIEREHAFFQTMLRNDDVTYYTPLKAHRKHAPGAAGHKGQPASQSLPAKGRPASWSVESYIQKFSALVTTSKGLDGYELCGKPMKYLTRAAEKTLDKSGSTLVVGFGLRGTGAKALRLKRDFGVPVALAEYGLISGAGIPSETPFKFSLMLDDRGIFFDTTRRSRTEQILLDDPDDEAMRERARDLIDYIVENNIVKYNDAPRIDIDEGKGKRRILVMDQTSGDLSISLGQCKNYTFQDMLDEALAQPDAHVFLKLHPEAVSGVKGANYDLEALQDIPNLTLLTDKMNAMHLIKQMDEVYVMTSGAGLEALMAGKPVTCFGVPFYAGWGLTTDRQPFANMRRERTLEDVVAAAFLKQTLWFDPVTQEPCSAEEALQSLVEMKESVVESEDA